MMNVLKIICLCITHTSDHGHRAWYNSSLPLIIYAEWFFLFAFASAVMIKQGGQSHLRSWDSTSHSNSTKQFKDLFVTLLHWTRRHLCRCVKGTLNWSYAEAFPLVAHRIKNLDVESLPNRAREKPGVSKPCCPDPAGQSQNSDFPRASRDLGRSSWGYNFTGELVKGLIRTNQLQLPQQSLCFSAAYYNSFLLPKNT